jgi:hypothetical protein
VADLASETPAPFDAAGSALTPSEQAVRFINSEVLNPPDQGTISFVKPFAEQVAVMALEDGRSFLQGLEQVLLVAIAKALEQLLAGGAAPAKAPVGPPADPDALPPANHALQAAERMLQTTLPKFYSSLADTVVRVRMTNDQTQPSSPPG